jgi:hypothetical protein
MGYSSNFKNNNYKVDILRNNEDKVTYLIKSFSMPSISVPALEVANKENPAFTTKTNSSQFSYSSLSIVHLLKEDLEEYLYYLDWLEQIRTNPETYCTIIIYITTNKGNVKYKCSFFGVHLVNLGGIEFRDNDESFPGVELTTEFEFESLQFDKDLDNQ